MASYSPETTQAAWLDGGTPVVGARFTGSNKLRFAAWSTVATVTAADPGRRFAFETGGPSLSTWTYDFEAVEGGTRVTESLRKQDDQIAPIRFVQRLAGVKDRHAHLRAGMTTTLDRLAAAVTTVPA